MNSPPTEFFGTERYKLIRKLGQGGMGAVHLAFDQIREFNIALKTLLDTNPLHLQRLKNEFRALADIVHPNLVRFYELEAQDNHWFITMEFIEGVPFVSHVRSPDIFPGQESSTFLSRCGNNTITVSEVLNQPLEPTTQETQTFDLEKYARGTGSATLPIGGRAPANYDLLRSTLAELCCGLEAVHAAGKLHCDIKPSNVLVGSNHRPILLDFGLVTEYRYAQDVTNEDKYIVGTAEYMSPEQAIGKSLTPATDWYSVGVLLFQALTGELPFRGKVPHVLRAKIEWDAIAPNLLTPHVPEDLNQLCIALLARQPSDRPNGNIIRQTLGPKATSSASNATTLPRAMPFVGRERSLQILQDAFQDVASEKIRPHWVYVHGQSGMGKTVLVKTFLETLHRQTTLLFTGRCHQRETVPFKALDGFVDSIVAHLTTLSQDQRLALLPPRCHDLAHVFPVFSQLIDVDHSSSNATANYNSEGLRLNAFTALKTLLRNMSQQHPLVIVVDDLQWGDLDSVAFLLSLFQTTQPFSFLFIGTYRTEAADNEILAPLLTAESEHIIRSNISIAPLSRAEAKILAQELLPSNMSGRDTLASSIAAEAQGSPYFVAELVLASIRNVQSNQTVASTLDDALYHRIQTLTPCAQRLLETISVAGGPVFQAPAISAAGLSSIQFSKLLPTLRDQRLVQTSGPGKFDTIETFHDRIRETVVARLPPDTLQAIHGALADHLESVENVAPETLVAHYRGANEHEKAAKYAIRAAHHALYTTAFEQAATLCRLALELIDTNDSRRSDLRTLLAEALSGAGHGEQASNAYLEAAQYAPSHVALEYKRRASEALLSVGQLDRGLRIGKEVLATLGTKLPRTQASAFVYLFWQRLLLRLGGLKLRKPVHTAPEDIVIAKTFTSVAMGLSMFEIGAATIQVRALRRSLNLGDRENAAVNVALEAGFQACGGSRAEKQVQKINAYANKLAAESTDPETLGMLKICDGIAKHLLGYWRDSVETCQAANDLLRRCSHVQWGINQSYNFHHSSLFYLGDFQAAEQLYQQATRWAEERNDRYLKTTMASGYHCVMELARSGDSASIRELSTNLRTEWRPNTFDSISFYDVFTHVNSHLYDGSYEAAWKLIVASWRDIRRAMFFWVELASTEMHELRARCAVATALCKPLRKKRLRQAKKHVRKIERTRVGKPMGLLIRAQITWLEGDSVTSRQYLSEAIGEFEAVDMAMYAAITRKRLGQLTQEESSRQCTDAADEFIRAQSIANPDRFVAMLTPGFQE